jgi:hypothetical protein
MTDYSDIDRQFLDYLDSKDTDSMLGPKGYQLSTNSKLENNMNEETELTGAQEVFSKGIPRAISKITEGTLSLPVALLNKIGVIDDQQFESFSKFFDDTETAIGEPKTTAGALSEGITQFGVPGVAWFKFFKQVKNPILRALYAEGATVGQVQVAGDPNLATGITDLLEVDRETADTASGVVLNYLATPNKDGTADAVFEDKFKAIITDAPLAPVAEKAVDGVVRFFKLFKKKDDTPAQMLSEGGEDFVKEFAEFKESPEVTEGVDNIISAIKRELDSDQGAGGFTMTLDGKDLFKDLDMKSGYIVAPLKQTETKIKVDGEFTNQDLNNLYESVFLLRKSLDTNKIDYGTVYFGAWKDGDTYVFDPSVKIDNVDDAIYIGVEGKQDSIMDIGAMARGDFDNAFIQTTGETGEKLGYEKLKRNKSFRDTKRIDQKADTTKIKGSFDRFRTDLQTGQ